MYYFNVSIYSYSKVICKREILRGWVCNSSFHLIVYLNIPSNSPTQKYQLYNNCVICQNNNIITFLFRSDFELLQCKSFPFIYNGQFFIFTHHITQTVLHSAYVHLLKCINMRNEANICTIRIIFLQTLASRMT